MFDFSLLSKEELAEYVTLGQYKGFESEKVVVKLTEEDLVKIEKKMKSLAEGNFEVVKKVYLPLTLPYVFTALLQSFGLGLKVLVMAEFISNAKHSIGYEIMLYKDHYNDMSYVYAWSIILIIFVLVVDYFVNIVHKRSLV